MLTLAAVGVVLCAASAAPPQLKLASPRLQAVGVDAAKVDFFSEHLAQQFKLAGAEMFTQREMQALLGVERQKQLMGCADEASACMNELANALGADALVLGDVARVGERTQLNLKVIAAQTGKTLGVFSQAVGSEDATLEALTRAAYELANAVSTRLGRSLSPVFNARGSVRKWGFVPLGLGLALGAAGAGLMAAAEQNYRALVGSTPTSLGEGRILATTGQLEQGLGVAALAVSGVALVVAVGLIVFGGAQSDLAAGQAHASLAGAWLW